MDLFILRPIITALLEYGLMLYVFRNGKFHPKVVAGILFCLATYQFGEVIFLLTDNSIGIQISYASTALLPAIGFIFIEKIINRNLGSIIISGFGAAFSAFFLLNSNFIGEVEKMHCFTKLIAHIENNGLIFWFWIIYYIGTLGVSCLILFYKYHRERNTQTQNILGWTFLAYLSFFPISILLVLVIGIDIAYLASIMCGLAIFAAIIMTWISIRYDEPVRYRY